MADQRRPQDRRNRRPEIQPEEKQFDERTLHIDRVARVVKGGRRFRFRALVVVGDKKNRVGIGSAKGADVTAAVTKATEVAKKNFITVSLYKGTLPHEVESKVSGAHILLKPASPGTGLIAAGQGKTAGRGTKGQGARAGSSAKPGFAGGSNPLMQKLPKLPGFRSHHISPENVYTGQLEQFANKTVDATVLAQAKLISNPY